LTHPEYSRRILELPLFIFLLITIGG
jgi:hypothetical protein